MSVDQNTLEAPDIGAQYAELLHQTKMLISENGKRFLGPENRDLRLKVLRCASLGEQAGRSQTEICSDIGIGGTTLWRLRQINEDTLAAQTIVIPTIDRERQALRERIRSLGIEGTAREVEIRDRKKLAGFIVTEYLHNKCDSVVDEVAVILSISKSALYSWIRKYGSVNNLPSKKKKRLAELEQLLSPGGIIDEIEKDAKGSRKWRSRPDIMKMVKTAIFLIGESGDQDRVQRFKANVGVWSSTLNSGCWQRIEVETFDDEKRENGLGLALPQAQQVEAHVVEDREDGSGSKDISAMQDVLNEQSRILEGMQEVSRQLFEISKRKEALLQTKIEK